VAIKLLPRGDFVKQYHTYVKREIQNQSSLRHPLIVSLREARLCFQQATQANLAFSGLYEPKHALFSAVLQWFIQW
jgi:hypothetical protein